jgi:hypothetical protein
MTEGLCPHCGKWFESLEIHLGKHRSSDLEAETMRRTQEQQKVLRDSKRRKNSP